MKAVYFLLSLAIVNVYAADLSPPKKFVEIRMDQPYVYGKFSKATDKEIEVEELLNLKCFYVFDYLDDDSVTQEKIDKANPEMLPWCGDASGGTLHKLTGKKLVYNTDKLSKFSIWSLEQGKPSLTLTKEAFVKKISESKGELIRLKVRSDGKNLIDTFETVYTD